MGVEAHRVMMTWLMHEVMPTKDLVPTAWEEFNARYAEAKLFATQNIVRASTSDRFTCFSWSAGLRSYTGYIAANSPDKNKIVVPYRAHNTGNLLGWYVVEGKATNAKPIVNGIYDLRGCSYTMNGELETNDAALNHRFSIYSTPGNAVIYLDYVRGNTDGVITCEQGGLLAISVDPLMKENRTIYRENPSRDLQGHILGETVDGTSLTTWQSAWVNMDNELGVVTKSASAMAFGDRSLSNSIYTAKLYPSYARENHSFTAGQVVDRRHIVYYSNMDAVTTRRMAGELQVFTEVLPEGWNGVIAPDPDGTLYLLLSNFAGNNSCVLEDITCKLGAPVFRTLTTVTDSKASAEFDCAVNHSVSDALCVFVKGTGLTAIQDAQDPYVAYIDVEGKCPVDVTVSIVCEEGVASGTFTLQSDVKVGVDGSTLKVERIVDGIE